MLKIKIPIYFIATFLSFGKNFMFTCSSLTLVVWIIQMNSIVLLGVKSTDLYFDILKLCTYVTPYIIFIITPIALFIALVLLLYQYRKENKILSLQNFGFSPKQIQIPIYLLSVIVIMFHYAICIVILPDSYKHFKSLQFSLKQKHLVSLVETNSIKTSTNGVTIYVDSKKSDNVFNGIFISDMRDKNIIRIFSAKEGSIRAYGSGISLKLNNGSYQQIHKDGKNGFLNFDSYSLVINNDNHIKTTNRTQDPNEMSFSQMFDFSENDTTELLFKKVKIAMHQKIIWPLYSIIFTVLCLNLEWLYYYNDYTRGKISKLLQIKILCALILASVNFFMRSISMKFLYMGSVLSYLFPILLLQLIFWMLKSIVRKENTKIKKWQTV